MPGITGVIYRENCDQPNAKRILLRLNFELCHLPWMVSQAIGSKNIGLGYVTLNGKGGLAESRQEKGSLLMTFEGVLEYLVEKEGGTKPIENGRVNWGELYSAHGDQIGEKLRGSFNLCIVDIKNEKLYIWNDRLGHRRLYYTFSDSRFAFSPEIKGFLKIPGMKKSLNWEAVADFFNYGYPLGSSTFLNEVKLLPPGHVIRLDLRKWDFEVKEYWRPRFKDSDWDEDLESLGRKAYELFMASLERKIGRSNDIVVPLSGGFDSRLILACSKELTTKLSSYTYGNQFFLERKLASRVSKSIGVKDHWFVDLKAEWLNAVGNWSIWAMDCMMEVSPFILAGICLTVQKRIRMDNSLFLNGIYGGPGFCSSGYYREEDISLELSQKEVEASFKRTLYGGTLGEHFYNLFAGPLGECIEDCYTERILREFKALSDASRWFCNVKELFFIRNRFIRYMDQIDLNRFFWNVRYPMASESMFEFYLGLSPHIRLGRKIYREIFRQKFPPLLNIPFSSDYHTKSRKIVPRAIYYLNRISRGRINLTNPYNTNYYDIWYRCKPSFRAWFEKVLLSKKTRDRGYYNPKELDKHIKYLSEGGNNFYLISQLVTFELFLRWFFEGEKGVYEIVFDRFG